MVVKLLAASSQQLAARSDIDMYALAVNAPACSLLVGNNSFLFGVILFSPPRIKDKEKNRI